MFLATQPLAAFRSGLGFMGDLVVLAVVVTVVVLVRRRSARKTLRWGRPQPPKDGA